MEHIRATYRSTSNGYEYYLMHVETPFVDNRIHHESPGIAIIKYQIVVEKDRQIVYRTPICDWIEKCWNDDGFKKLVGLSPMRLQPFSEIHRRSPVLGEEPPQNGEAAKTTANIPMAALR
jgi:hypothetical protein